MFVPICFRGSGYPLVFLMGWATFWAFFSQTRLATLLEIQAYLLIFVDFPYSAADRLGQFINAQKPSKKLISRRVARWFFSNQKYQFG
jgi:hypothetical protein